MNTHKEYKLSSKVFDSNRTKLNARFNIGYFEDYVDERTQETMQRFVRTEVGNAQIDEWGELTEQEIKGLLEFKLDFHIKKAGLNPADYTLVN